ncbi:hypothetical protein KW850_05390 [Bacillus sp. sid0103]|uniref:hypothetical protein n=1 Tax=Bacillus sp. sid0103 TaxID=2856337 RepID=UPI001C43C419|nr:hypothetical protein [Bacillus sp. sid0103]MBV7504698.1 hypothetical protein [Bacillus sp. sid0103]
MILKIEEWLIKQDFTNEAHELFDESIRCYKASAYRAALLFSFLGLQTVIKIRMLSSQPPKDYADPEWKHVQKGLLDDDSWEKKVIEAIQNKKKPIFNLTEDVYEQYFYWKNRRNDCAHAKGNIISHSHVESFWLFIQSNLGKFVVNGGMAFIVQQIDEHFDVTITPRGESFDHIVTQIPYAIERINYKDFLQQLMEFSYIKKDKYREVDEQIILFWFKLFSLQDDLPDETVEFLIKEENHKFTMALLRSKPEMVRYFFKKEKFIRLLWKKLFMTPYDYSIFLEMVINDLIPEEQFEEASKHMFNTIDTDIFEEGCWWVDRKVTELDKGILISKKFFDNFYNEAFEKRKIVHSFAWGNKNKGLVICYINNFDLDEKVVDALNSSITSLYAPKHLKSDLREFYKLKPHILEQHIEITERLGEKLPQILMFD